MTDETALSGAAAAGSEGLATQLHELSAYLADSEAAGRVLQPEAAEMVTRLRELVRALDGLAATCAVTVSEVTAAADVDEVRRLVFEYASAHADTPGVEYMRADAAGLPGPFSQGNFAWIPRVTGSPSAPPKSSGQ